MSELMKHIRAFILKHGTNEDAVAWSNVVGCDIDADGDVKIGNSWARAEALADFAKWLANKKGVTSMNLEKHLIMSVDNCQTLCEMVVDFKGSRAGKEVLACGFLCTERLPGVGWSLSVVTDNWTPRLEQACDKFQVNWVREYIREHGQ